MQEGGVAVRDVYSISGRVIINGVDVGADIEEISVDRDIPDGFPGGSSFRSATGSVTATVSEPVDSRPPTPWTRKGNWPPKPMDRVEIVLSDGEREWTQFVGTVKEPAGSTDSLSASFTVQDNYQSLNELVTLPALARSMPSPVEGEHNLYIGLDKLFIADAALRQVGRYATPPRVPGDVVGATLQGSAWPERGTVKYALRNTPDGDAESYPDWRRSTYGMCVQNIDARYGPTVTSLTPGNGRVTSNPVEFTQEVVDLGPGSTQLLATFPGGGRIGLAHNFTTVFARYYRPDDSTVDLAQIPRDGLQRVVAVFSWSNGTLYGQLRGLTDGREIRSSTTGSVAASYLTGVIEQVRANGLGSQGAFQVSFPPSGREWSALRFQPNTIFRVAISTWNSLIAIPTQVKTQAIKLLEDIAQAELSQWWIDEHDVLQWWDRGQLSPRPAVAKLTGADHIRRMPWKYDYDALRRKVVVRYKESLTEASLRSSVTLWQGNKTTLQDGDETETFISSPNDEVWLGVHHQDVYRYSKTFSHNWPNRGVGTIVGGIAVDDDGVQHRSDAIGTAVRRVTDDTYVITKMANGLRSGETGVAQLPDEYETDTSLWSVWRGETLPILRGKKKVTLIDETYASPIEGPSHAPVYEHNAGFWIQSELHASNVAEYAAASLTQPVPTIDQAEIMPVFNLQVGDVVILADPEVTGLEVAGVVTGNSISADLAKGSADQRISITPRSIRLDGATWTDFGEAQRDNDWAQFGANWSNEIWDQFGRNPLN